MLKHLFVILLLISLFTFYGYSFQNREENGKTYYVSPTGDNSNPGTKEKPWATPGYGSRQLKAGDTLIILGGKYILSQYDDDIIIPQNSGTPEKWITIKGEESNRPILAGRDNLLTAIDLSGRSYIKIENLEITSNNGEPFRDGIEALNGPISNIIIKNIYIHHIDEFGINISDVNGIQILDTKISYCGFGCVGGPEGQQGGWQNVLIDRCVLSYSGHYYQGEKGPGPYDRPDGFGIEPSKGPIEIANTLVEHNRGDGLDSKAENTYIHHCIVANNSCDGIKLWGNNSKIENTLIYGRGDGNTESTPWSAIVISTEKSNSSFFIINVTVDDEIGKNYLMYAQYDYPDIPINLTIINNIFSARGLDSPIFFGNSVKFKMEHNLFYMPKHPDRVIDYLDKTYGSTEINKIGKGNIYGDPLFIQTAFGNIGDYHLKDKSPAIDNGILENAPKTDLDNKPRPLGKGVDIGAYEK
jgi:hypothetical protein